jgi:hypothetical protein
MKFLAALLVTSLTFGALSCKKDPEPIVPPKPDSGDMEIIFNPVAGNKALRKDSGYALSAGETFTVTKFTYYISNIVLNRTDGHVFRETDSYHLVSHMDGRQTITVTGIPPGTYTSIGFMIGVDSLRNVSGAQSGDLDPDQAMFWDWNTGYIFYKIEGSYHSFSGVDDDYAIHVGGFSGPYKALQEVVLDPGTELSVSASSRLHLQVNADASEIFRTPHDLGFDTYRNQLQQPDLMKRLSENYRDMFSVALTFYTKK